MTLPERLARKAAPCNCVEAIRHACWACRTRPAIEAAIREAIEACAKRAESWPLSVENMRRADRYAQHGWRIAVAGVCGAIWYELLTLIHEELPDGD